MQYASIVIDHPAGAETYTYQIPPEHLAHLAVGSVVLVPFGRKTVHGVLTGFARGVDANLATKLKPLVSVVYPGPFIPEYIMQGAVYLQKQFGLSLGDTLFSFLPSWPKRKQKPVEYEVAQSTSFEIREMMIGLPERIALYRQLAESLRNQNKSLLILCATQANAELLAQSLNLQSVILYPGSVSDKNEREYYLKALVSSESQVFIGTRGAVKTPLVNCGAVVIDEPWLPGHKEDNSPKLWSCLAMSALCRSRGIPLYLVSCLSWPETQLLGETKLYRIKGADAPPLSLMQQRSLHESIETFVHHHAENAKSLCIVVHESKHDTWWCGVCQVVRAQSLNCPKCHKELIHIPRLTTELVRNLVDKIGTSQKVTINSFQDLLGYQLYDATLVLGIDALLSITDFRAHMYIYELIQAIRSQSKSVSLATRHREAWTSILNQDVGALRDKEYNIRQEYNFPPFTWLIQLRSAKKELLESALHKSAGHVQRASGIFRSHDDYTVHLYLKRPSLRVLNEINTKGVKVDIMPNYIS
jgi:primosomal protein N'